MLTLKEGPQAMETRISYLWVDSFDLGHRASKYKPSNAIANTHNTLESLQRVWLRQVQLIFPSKHFFYTLSSMHPN